MSSTALIGQSVGVPGWYIEFQTAVLRQLPRPGEIDKVRAQFWANNQRGLKTDLSQMLVGRFQLAYDRLEYALRSLLTGEKISFDIVAGENEVIIRAQCKITNTQIKRMIDVRHSLVCPVDDQPLYDRIQDLFLEYEEELGEIKATHKQRTS